MTHDASVPTSDPARVLIVEDEWVVAIDVRDCLEELGYRVVAIVASGEEAIVKARELRPDVVLMDINLEREMDGIQAAYQIWNELQIPVIYATGYSDQATVDRATDNELFGYVIKPIKERDLYITVKTALQRHGRETRLKEEHKWASTILKAIGDGVIVTNAQGYIKFFNLVAESLTGWKIQEVINQPLWEVFPLIHSQTQAVVENPVMEVLRTGNTAYLVDPVLLVTKNNQQIPIADSAAPLKDDAGTLTGVVMVFRDASQRQSIQEQSLSLLQAQILEQQMQELQRLDQLKDDFLSTASHELRSPLTNIKMSIHMLELSLDRRQLSSLESETDSRSEQVSRYLRILREECDQELNLVNDLLELQRLDVAVLPIELVSINLTEWIPQITEAYQERAQERQQRLQVLLSPTLPPLISDDAILTRSFSELLANACKYTPPGEVITVSAQLIEHRLQLVVSNSGVSILDEELPRVFDRFHRIAGSDRWNQGGTGLGLALVKRQITYLGGSIWAESDANEVRFVIELPFVAN